MHLTWTSYTEEYATELGLTLDDIQTILTSTTAFHERVSGPIYAYVDQGIRVTIDTHTCTVLRVEYDLDPDALDDWYFTPQAIDDCMRLKTTPVSVVDSIDDAQPYPAASMCTIYRGAYDVLANESKSQIVSIEPAGTFTSTDQQGIRRISGGTPTRLHANQHHRAAEPRSPCRVRCLRSRVGAP